MRIEWCLRQLPVLPFGGEKKENSEGERERDIEYGREGAQLSNSSSHLTIIRQIVRGNKKGNH